jgi:hypothetical protein
MLLAKLVSASFLWNIVTCIPIVRQWLGKHIPAQAKARNSKISFARRLIRKHTSLTIDAVFSDWFLQNGYKEVFSRTQKESEVKSRVSGRQPAGICVWN